ncbi:MAG: tetratricopeptide repeat protein, partial [Candidatus Binatia bacterium]
MLVPAILVVLVLAVYSPTLRAGFTSWDDERHITTNPVVVAGDGLVRSWTDPPATTFYFGPVTTTTWWAEWHLAGGAPWLFHLDNVLLHAANVVLVGALMRALSLTPPWAWLIAGLWGLHPIAVGTVAWATERKNVLFVFLWLCSLLLYLRATARPTGVRLRLYVLSLVAFALALLSKGAALSLFTTLPLVEWLRGRRLRVTVLRTLPYAALGVLAGVGLVGTRPEGALIAPLATRLPIAARALWFYVGTFLWPRELLPVYPKWGLGGPGAAEWTACAALVAAGVLAMAFRHALPRLFWLGLGLFLTNALLVIGVVWFPYLRHAYVSDHLAYLPSLGLALALVVAVRELARARGISERTTAGALAAAILVLAAASAAQTRIWRDSETLCTYTLAHNPDCFMCHANLGIVLRERGELEAAAEHFEIALRIDPDANILVHLGNLRQQQGRLEDAALYERAATLDPGYDTASYDLGNVLRELGRSEAAIPHYRQALAAAPASLNAHHNLALALWESGRPDEARAEFEAALHIDPTDADTIVNLARLLDDTGSGDAALALLEPASRGSALTVRQSYAALLMKRGRAGDAARVLESA